MSYKNKKPPMTLVITKNKFNMLVQQLVEYEKVNEDTEKIVSIKNKLLKYSMPFGENEDIKISIRFFPDGASNLLSILISNLNEIDLEDDYYNMLLENREAYKKK